ncbi:MAG: hypothetical protein IT324_25515 [Anaerolineae bacterium]|nr:hypothetical protein [Anaerolineae bacterium]
MKPGQYSYLLFLSLPLLALVIVGAWRLRTLPLWVRIGSPLVVVALLFALWTVIRPTSSPEAASVGNVDRVLASGKPTVIEFYSEY